MFFTIVRPDNGDTLAGLDFERQIAEQQSPGARFAETNRSKLDLSVDTRQKLSTNHLSDLTRSIKEFKDWHRSVATSAHNFASGENVGKRPIGCRQQGHHEN